MNHPFNTIFMYRSTKKKLKNYYMLKVFFVGILHNILFLKNKTVCYVNTDK